MITLEVVECHILKKIVYSNSKIPNPQNERKQTGPYIFAFMLDFGFAFNLT
jgi:hypothetical protein